MVKDKYSKPLVFLGYILVFSSVFMFVTPIIFYVTADAITSIYHGFFTEIHINNELHKIRDKHKAELKSLDIGLSPEVVHRISHGRSDYSIYSYLSDEDRAAIVKVNTKYSKLKSETNAKKRRLRESTKQGVLIFAVFIFLSGVAGAFIGIELTTKVVDDGDLVETEEAPETQK